MLRASSDDIQSAKIIGMIQKIFKFIFIFGFVMTATVGMLLLSLLYTRIWILVSS